MQRTFRNPILSGFYPDPSICRAGEDYYLVTSTFEYFPGLPIFHSRDLVHWRQIGHVLDRPSQLPLDGVRASAGLYAPTIRYSQGVFYVINTLVDGATKSGNFIVTATDPAGPWSEPYWLDGADGIDPSLFFDDDADPNRRGKAWYVGTRLKASSSFAQGQTEIWLQELDLAKMRLVGEQFIIWDGAVKNAVWSESPHLYKIDGRYYLLTAEGGTAHHHSVMIARSAAITGPYEGNRGNPIVTHRHLGLDYPIVGTGHADLIDTPAGEWWMVLLAMRPYGGYYYNLGRETFLAPVTWEEGWPIVSAGTGRIEFTYPAPNLPEHVWPTVPDRDEFDQPTLAPQWFFLRTPRDDFWSLSERSGWLRLRLRPERLAERVNPSFVGRRQQHIHFSAQTLLEFTPQTVHECAGLALVQNDQFHFCFVVTRTDQPVIRLIKRAAGVEEILAEQPIAAGRCTLKIEAHEQAYSFAVAVEPDRWQVVAEGIDGRILSTPVAGGFVGAVIALYASSNGQASTTSADFDWFEYRELEAERMHPLEFTLPSHDEDALIILRQAVEDFRRAHRNLPINFTELPWTTAWSDLVRVALYKDGAEVSEVGSTWVGSFVGMDALRPYTSSDISRVGRAAAFLPSAWQNGSLIGDDQLWAVPWLSDTRVIFYWRDMLEHAGIDEAGAFLSFEQMEETLARLRSHGISTPWAMTTRRTANTLYNIASWIWGAGGDFMSADGKRVQVAEPEARAGMTHYYDLYRYMPQRSEPMDSIAAFELFQNQSVAAIASGPWFLKWLRRQGVPPYTLSRIGVSLLPGPSFVGGTSLVIWKHVAVDHEQAAAELVHYLVTNPALLEFYHQAGLLPARHELLAQPPFSTEPHYQTIIKAIEAGRTHSRIPMWGLVEDRLTTTLAHIWSEVRANPTQDIAALVEENMVVLAQRLDATLRRTS